MRTLVLHGKGQAVLKWLTSEGRSLWKPSEMSFLYSSFKQIMGTQTMVCGALERPEHHGMTSEPFFWCLRLSPVLSWTLQHVERVLRLSWASSSPERHNEGLAPFHIAPFFSWSCLLSLFSCLPFFYPSAFLLFVISFFLWSLLFFHILPHIGHFLVGVWLQRSSSDLSNFQSLFQWGREQTNMGKTSWTAGYR